MPPDQGGRTGQVRALDEHVPSVRVGRPGLGVLVVAVVPDHDQPELVHRREGSRAGAQHDAYLAPAGPQEGAVALGGPQVGPQHRRVELTQRRCNPVTVPGVRYDDQRTPTAGHAGPDGQRDLLRPARTGQRTPHCPRRAARGQRREERRAGRVALPAPRRGDRWQCQRAVGAGLGLDAGVPRRHREPQDVPQGSGVAVGDGAAQRRDLGMQDRLRADQGQQRRQGAGVRAGRDPLEHDAVDLPAREAHADAAAGLRCVKRRRHRVVEGPVQVCQATVDGDPGDRQHGLQAGHGLRQGRSGTPT